MAYGTIKVDNITFTTAGADAFTTVSGIYRAITSGVTVSGTISGNTIQGATISGTTSIFGSGTVTSPSVSIGTGTTYAPGIYSSGTDQLAISTNGTGRLFIDSSGRVGLGTSSPLNNLDVAGDISLSSGGANVIRVLQNLNAAAYTGPGFYSASSFGYGVSSSGTHRWIGIDGNTEIMRLDGSGRLLVGTSTAATARVQIQGVTGSSVYSTEGISVVVGGNTVNPNGRGVVADFSAGGASDPATTYGATINLGASSIGLWGIRIVPGGAFAISDYYPGGSYVGASNPPTERFRINSSGRVLIGTSSTSSTAGLIVQGAGGAAPGIIRACYTTATPADGDTFGYLVFGDSAHSDAAWVAAARDGGTWSASSKPSRLVFSTTADGASSPTERMRITSGGYVKASNTGVYTDAGGGSRATNSQHFFRSDQNGLTIQATNTNLGGAVEGFTSDFATGATGTHFIGAINLVRTFIVYANGNVANTNNSYGAISDIKLKENIVDAKSQWNDLKALQVRNYNLKEGQTHTQIGLIAQEVELVSPGLVNESPDLDKDGVELGTVTKRVNYSVLYMKAVKALQEAMERIETLEAKVAALESA